ncbi:restriction endonuclease [Paeniglutamicibacter antarcticus]|uniref:Restriction endonuclease n=1 Tax=Arthrobacter terrae TaxID=2935737 RepID=A0A931CH92_9MICC|nr:restriction endonuclease [Arthrobacter terrae]MBG0738547.1 restriction endonuclease [Arthrobacter terrae]
MLRHLVLDELQSDSVTVELDEETMASLRDTGLVSVAPARGGRWVILPCGPVGAVQVGELLVEVKPKAKVGLSRLLFLLGYARNPGFRPDDVTGLEDKDLFSALAESLVRQAERAFSQGVLNGYVSVDDALRTVRGRIRVGDQMTRRPGMLIPLEVSYDDFTVDIPENRILRGAIRLMLHLPRLSGDLQARLGHLDAKLDGVALLRPGRARPVWRETRLNDRYVPALRLAEIILQNMSAEAGLGRQTVTSFVVNMATVFEDFVTTALTEALSKYPGQTMAQYETYLDEEDGRPNAKRVQMYVDVVHEIERLPALIFDAKYKAASFSGYPNADHYQMLAYCTALRLPVAWLVYAGSGPSRTRRIRNSEVSIVEFPIDVSQTPEMLLVRVQRLADSALRFRVGSALAEPVLMD